MNEAIIASINALREHCNQEIRRYNGSPKWIGSDTPVSFEQFNNLLKACDKVFREVDLASIEPYRIERQSDGTHAVLDRQTIRGVFTNHKDAIFFASMLSQQ